MSSTASNLHLPLFILQLPQKTLASYDISPQAWFELMAEMADVDLTDGNIINSFITLDSYCEIVKYARTLFGDEKIYSIYLKEITPSQLGPAGMVLTTAPTLGDGLNYWVNCGKFVLPMIIIEQHLNDTHYFTTSEYTVDIGDISNLVVELLVLLTIRLIQQMTDGKARVGAHFRHKQPLPSHVYEEHLGFVPAFEATETGFSVDRRDLDIPNGDHSFLAHQQALHAQGHLEAVASVQILHSHRVRQLLVEAGLRGRFPDQEEVTALLKCTPRTLARRLADESTTFRDIQAEARIELAKQLLLKPGMAIKAVYERAGFSDLSAFARAFRRYTKFTPKEFQERFKGKN